MNNDILITLIDTMLDTTEKKSSSEAIEDQERKGQQSVIKHQILPKKSNKYSVPEEIKWNNVEDSMEWEEKHKIIAQNNIEYTKQQYEKMGIIVVEEYDDLFWNVKLPEGWEIKATDHNMWNDLFDNKGRKRANFFYKGSFYDRDAFINFDTRFHVIVNHVADADSDYDIWIKSDYQGIIEDGEETIFSTECVPVTGSYDGDNKVKDILRKQLEEYMNKNYPNYIDINAYWD